MNQGEDDTDFVFAPGVTEISTKYEGRVPLGNATAVKSVPNRSVTENLTQTPASLQTATVARARLQYPQNLILVALHEIY